MKPKTVLEARRNGAPGAPVQLFGGHDGVADLQAYQRDWSGASFSAHKNMHARRMERVARRLRAAGLAPVALSNMSYAVAKRTTVARMEQLLSEAVQRVPGAAWDVAVQAVNDMDLPDEGMVEPVANDAPVALNDSDLDGDGWISGVLFGAIDPLSSGDDMYNIDFGNNDNRDTVAAAAELRSPQEPSATPGRRDEERDGDFADADDGFDPDELSPAPKRARKRARNKTAKAREAQRSSASTGGAAAENTRVGSAVPDEGRFAIFCRGKRQNEMFELPADECVLSRRVQYVFVCKLPLPCSGSNQDCFSNASALTAQCASGPLDILESTTGAVQLLFTNAVGHDAAGAGELASAQVEMSLCSQTPSWGTRPRIIVVRGGCWLSFCAQFRSTAAMSRRKDASKQYMLRLSFRGVPVCQTVFSLKQNKQSRSDVGSPVDMAAFAFAPHNVLSSCYAFNAALPWGQPLRAGYAVVPAAAAASVLLASRRQRREADDDDNGDDGDNDGDDDLVVVRPRKMRAVVPAAAAAPAALEYDGRGRGPMGAPEERDELVTFQARLEAVRVSPVEQHRLLQRRMLWVAHRLAGVLSRPVSTCKRISMARACRATLTELTETLALHKKAGLSDDAALAALNAVAPTADAGAADPVLVLPSSPPDVPHDHEPVTAEQECHEQMTLRARWPTMTEADRASSHAQRMAWVARRLLVAWHRQGSVGPCPPAAALLTDSIRASHAMAMTLSEMVHELIDFNLWNDNWDQTLADFNKDSRRPVQTAAQVPAPQAPEPRPPWVVPAPPPLPPSQFELL